MINSALFCVTASGWLHVDHVPGRPREFSSKRQDCCATPDIVNQIKCGCSAIAVA
jgi:hypothetical protein